MVARKAFVEYAYGTSEDSTALKRLAIDTIAFLVDAVDARELKSCVGGAS